MGNIFYSFIEASKQYPDSKIASLKVSLAKSNEQFDKLRQ